MPDTLKRPSAPQRISELPFHEPMRMTYGGEPVVAMKVGTSTYWSLLVIDKSGGISGVSSPSEEITGLSFIDYLLEDESFTVYGSATERSDEADLGPDPKYKPFLPDLAIGSCNYREVPNFTTFYTKNRYGERRLTIIIHDHPVAVGNYKGLPIEGIVIAGGFDYERYGAQDGYFEATYRFDGWAPGKAGEFRRSGMVKEHIEYLRQVPGCPSDW